VPVSAADFGNVEQSTIPLAVRKRADCPGEGELVAGSGVIGVEHLPARRTRFPSPKPMVIGQHRMRGCLSQVP
jgi:hypothetical protein